MDPLQGGQTWSKSDQANRSKLPPYPGECHTHGHAGTAGGGKNTRRTPKHFKHILNILKYYSMSNLWSWEATLLPLIRHRLNSLFLPFVYHKCCILVLCVCVYS